jgi:excinuclease UvrABC nuclease subunit
MLLDEDGIKLEVIENDLGLHEYGISRQTWRRGVRFMNVFGAEQALEMIDRRAERATERGDYETARRWRDLITAIHAIQEDERLPGDNVH